MTQNINFVLHLDSPEHIRFVHRIAAREILVSAEPFSVAGKIRFKSIKSLFSSLQKTGRSVSLLWDRFCKNSQLDALLSDFEAIRDSLDAVRFTDPGVGLLLKKTFPALRLQFLMWDGNQNSISIQNWEKLLHPALERIVLSNQMTASVVGEVVMQSVIPFEIKVLGRFPLFTSARRLPAAAGSDLNDQRASMTLISDDQPSQCFPIRQSSRNTVIYNDKDLFLVDKIDALTAMGISWFNLEPHTKTQFECLADRDPVADATSIRNAWDRPLTTGFFEENRTAAPLDDLSNRFLKNENQEQVATVIEAQKHSYLLLHIQRRIELPCHVVFLTPEQRSIRFQLSDLQDMKGEVKQNSISEGYYLLPWIKHVVPASLMKIIDSPPEHKAQT